MRIAIIGRSEVLFATAEHLRKEGHEIFLIVTAKEAPEYTKTSTDFRLLAESWGVSYIHTPHVEEAINLISSLQLDIGVSFNYPGIIPQSVIDLFSLGILNAHGGDLPRYRGNACQAWAILNGETQVGLCVHRMIGGELDSGDIVTRDYFSINLNTKVTIILQWINQRIPQLFSEAIAKLASDNSYVLECQSADPKDSLRCYPRKPQDGRIDWYRSNVEILRLINASNKPYSGAFCEFEGEKLIIWDAILAPYENFLAVPGQVTAIKENYVEVACGLGKLRLQYIEYLGKTGLPKIFFHSLRQRLE